TSSVDGELAPDSTSSTAVVPSILDTTPLSVHVNANVTSDSFSYTVPSGGKNRVFVVLMGKNDGNHPPSAMTLNGQNCRTRTAARAALARFSIASSRSSAVPVLI